MKPPRPEVWWGDGPPEPFTVELRLNLQPAGAWIESTKFVG